jgi:hypothetical protein
VEWTYIVISMIAFALTRVARNGGSTSRTRTDDETEDSPIMPEHICENEAEREEWRAAVLGFIRDRIDPLTTYRLAESDFELIELLPEKPGWLEQEEYELGLGRNRR